MNNETEQELKKIEEGLKPPSIALIGRTDTGKSRLITAFFGLDDDEIKVDAGSPETKYYKRYPSPYNPDIPIIFYYSPDYEASKASDFIDDTLKFLNDKSLSNAESADNSIHLVWYFIDAESTIEYFDKKVIQEALKLKIPVIIVLIQSDIAISEELSKLKKKLSEVLDEIEEKENTRPKFMEVSLDPIPGKTISGLKELTEASKKAIPKSYSEAFIRVQAVNVKLKNKIAYSLVATAATVCFGSAFFPIPGSTPLSIIATQPTLLASLAKVYNLDRLLDKSVVAASLGFTALLAIAGTTIVDVGTSFLSTMFPPLFVPGESITGGVAASYILAVGLAYTFTLEALSIRNLNSNMNREDITIFFKGRFASELKRYQKEVEDRSTMKEIKELLESLKRGDYNPPD
ncbi:hypothetical protein [Okeania sp. SIO1I7]|uniref:hypothetical protein n=1 Tax=Okeania sp. SIO1I7 TaxID=2607772 RepID=UPI0013F7AB9F|nr:hypothetical protein [Okeania sp. SIO1I7]NET26328.1 hypothetical protein [Okeania sp. SIO1I7]